MEILNCEKHGDHEVKEQEIMGRIFRFEKCPKCSEEQRVEEDNKRIEEDKKRAEGFKVERRLKAGISKRNLYKDFDSYIATSDGQKKALTQCKKFVESFPDAKNMLMLGSVGTGKTLLAGAVIESLVDKHDCTIQKAVDVFRDIKETYSRECDHTERQVINYLINRPLLIIDEVGMQINSEMEKLLMFDIIDGRYQSMLPTILISNLDIDGVIGVIGERCVDRLREGGGTMIKFDWESARV